VPLAGGVAQRAEQNSFGWVHGVPGEHAWVVHSIAMVSKQPPVTCP
jgi:hypothetical protein